MRKLRVAVFVSGGGTNLQALIDAAEAGDLSIDIAAVISNKPNAKALERAREHGIPALSVPSKGLTREAHETAVQETLEPLQQDLCVFAGYMRLVSGDFIRYCHNRTKDLPGIINIHPAMLPAFPGVDGYGDAYRYGVKASGITVHFIDEGTDTGPIILQESFPRLPQDTLEDFRARGLAIEHAVLPRAIQYYAEDRLVLEDRYVRILNHPA
ncbi:MAG: phosphoribosylglycinamide formyltransferase [Proteobacteria bacterium]|nr:phosphoribosylglycinamide formyltransferase [Pseudomonadota bacterium]